MEEEPDFYKNIHIAFLCRLYGNVLWSLLYVKPSVPEVTLALACRATHCLDTRLDIPFKVSLNEAPTVLKL